MLTSRELWGGVQHAAEGKTACTGKPGKGLRSRHRTLVPTGDDGSAANYGLARHR